RSTDGRVLLHALIFARVLVVAAQPVTQKEQASGALPSSLDEMNMVASWLALTEPVTAGHAGFAFMLVPEFGQRADHRRIGRIRRDFNQDIDNRLRGHSSDRRAANVVNPLLRDAQG